MSLDGDEKSWICGGAGNFYRVSSIVREFREPCLPRSPAKGNKMLKPEKWHSVFGNDGKPVLFRKALKLIILGGVDPSIRPGVWEFLLGCYTIGSTAESRERLRLARRERYEDLIRECQTMHSSIGTGTLAYAVGSKVMDVRTQAFEDKKVKEEAKPLESPVRSMKSNDTYSTVDSNHNTEVYTQSTDNCNHPCNPLSVGGDTAGVAFDSFVSSSDVNGDPLSKSEVTVGEDNIPSEFFFDFPPLPVTNLFQTTSQADAVKDNSTYSELFHTETMHSFQINNNVDLIIESNNQLLQTCNSHPDTQNCIADQQTECPNSAEHKNRIVNRLRISDVPESAVTIPSTLDVSVPTEGRVSEWLWMLHRIAVDVVRTDSHLDFYEDSKNVARMSDILAVYAWVDPATGYCQGMSDLLSPFVVLYEDDADAFWCFEMLLRRMRANFQMDGPTGVMKQLKTLWKVLELTDAEVFSHLSIIGAESLHFAFRMLLVLFRRELTFDEALYMWEMMWAADFDEAFARELDGSCLEALVIHLHPENSNPENLKDEVRMSRQKAEQSEDIQDDPEDIQDKSNKNNGIKSDPKHPFCGLTKANFWTRNQHMQTGLETTPLKDGDRELSVFCVAAILILNRQKIMKETHSLDDVIKIFNDNVLKIRVKKCIRMAIKLRKKYFYKQTKHTTFEDLNASTMQVL